MGLDYLHSQKIAHGDIQPGNVCVALDSDLSSIGENEIQRDVWVSDVEPTENQDTSADGNNALSSDGLPHNLESETNQDVTSQDADASSSDSSSDSDGTSVGEWEEEFNRLQALTKAQWERFQLDKGDPLAPPHSPEWNKANFLNSRDDIELLHQKDGKPLLPNKIQYTIRPTPRCSPTDLNNDKPFRLVLIDLGFARPFDVWEKYPLKNASDFRPPELLLGIPTTHKADIFSLGLLF